MSVGCCAEPPMLPHMRGAAAYTAPPQPRILVLYPQRCGVNWPSAASLHALDALPERSQILMARSKNMHCWIRNCSLFCFFVDSSSIERRCKLSSTVIIMHHASLSLASCRPFVPAASKYYFLYSEPKILFLSFLDTASLSRRYSRLLQTEYFTSVCTAPHDGGRVGNRLFYHPYVCKSALFPPFRTPPFGKDVKRN